MSAKSNIDSNTDVISSWQFEEQPRQRLLQRGAEHLAVAELLAICIGSGQAGENAVSMARRLLAQFGSVDALLAASAQQLLACRGLGEAKVAQLKAIHELAIRNSEAQLTRPEAFADVNAVSRYIQRRIGQRQREVFGCLFLNTRHQLVAWEELFLGSIDRAHVHAREVLRRAMDLNAAAVVLGHNHPSGVAEPSHADLTITKELSDLLAKVDVRVLDHIIVTRGDTVSLASRGLI